MPLPDLAPLCIQTTVVAGGLCVTLPGGVQLCAQVGFETGDPLEMVRSLLGQINTALLPLTPLFDIIDVVKAIADCIQAIPDAITHFDPTGIVNCVPGLVKVLNKLLKLLPQLTVPAMIRDIIHVIVFALLAIRQQLQAFLQQLQRILDAATTAAQTGNLALQVIVDCESANLDADMLNLNAGMEPLNRLIGVVNTLAQMVGLPCVPTLAGVELTEEALAPIDAAIALLQAIEAALPSFAIPPIPEVGPDGKCQ